MNEVSLNSPSSENCSLPKAHTASDSAVLRQVAIFAALSMFCASIEYLFPRPLPFFRLGLANLPIILALPLLRFRHLALLTLLKVLGQALVNGTLLSYVFLFSLVGSFASFLLMYCAHRYVPLSYIGLSLVGALASNTVQSLFSVLFIFGRESWIIVPIFYALGFTAGIVVGFLAEKISRESLWFRVRYEGLLGQEGIAPFRMSAILTRVEHSEVAGDQGDKEADGQSEPPSALSGDRSEHGHAEQGEQEEPTSAKNEAKKRKRPRKKRRSILSGLVSTPAVCLTGLCMLPIFILVEHPLTRLFQVLFLALLVRASGKRLSYGYFGFLIASVVLFHAFIPQGRVLLTLGQLSITEGAVLSGLYRALTIIGFVFISLFSIRSDLALPGRVGMLIRTTLYCFDCIYGRKQGIRRQKLVKHIDSLLSDLEDSADVGSGDGFALSEGECASESGQGGSGAESEAVNAGGSGAINTSANRAESESKSAGGNGAMGASATRKSGQGSRFRLSDMLFVAPMLLLMLLPLVYERIAL